MSEPAGASSPLVVIASGNEHPDGDEPPSSRPVPTRPTGTPPGPTSPTHLWADWRWQSQNAVRHARQLADLLPFSAEEREALNVLTTQYKLAIPPYYFSLIDR